jgi:hypothetical protein
MTIRFYLDPETEQPHIYGNAVDEGEVIDVSRIQARIVRGEKAPGSPSVRHGRDATCA